MANDNRRKSTRVHFQTTASLHFEDADFENCETADLSVKGVFVVGIEGREIGDECAVALQLSGASSDLVIRTRGEIARVQEEGIAVKFLEVDLDSFYHLKNIVYYNSEDPDALTGEFDPAFVFEGEDELRETFEE